MNVVVALSTPMPNLQHNLRHQCHSVANVQGQQCHVVMFSKGSQQT